MRELISNEIDQVGGGFVPLMVFGGAALAGTTSYLSGNSSQVVIASTVLGGLSGVVGAAARVTTGILRFKFATQSAGLSVASGTISSAGGGVEADAAQEIEVSK